MVLTPEQVDARLQNLVKRMETRDGHEKEFLQAAHECIDTLKPVFSREADGKVMKYSGEEYLEVLERIVEPERLISFRVTWTDDKGVQQVNRGYRVQFNSALGPYKGGLRFHPSVTQSILKFLGFEQIFKNSLTTLPMGGGKGGSDFDPKGKSDREVYNFCNAFMMELSKHIGRRVDVPAGDIGVGGREIGYLFGAYKRLRNEAGDNGVLTGKPLEFGGSLIRPEATGYGTIYYADHMMRVIQKKSFEGKRCLLSGSGNVSQYACEKLLDLKAVPISMSDSAGTILVPEGFDRELLAKVMDLKNVQRGRLSELKDPRVVYFAKCKPWGLPNEEYKGSVDCAFPCATQNEIVGEEAQTLVNLGCYLVAEGANMPTDNEGIAIFQKNGVSYGPAKAANAGGVAVSGLEMTQNFTRLAWSKQEVDGKLANIMKDIFDNCHVTCQAFGFEESNLQAGANIAGFLKVANAMIQQGFQS